MKLNFHISHVNYNMTELIRAQFARSQGYSFIRHAGLGG